MQWKYNILVINLVVIFVLQVSQFVQTSVISGLTPARMTRFAWRMFLKTITSLFMVKTSALQTRAVWHTRKCMEMARTSVRKCGLGPTIIQHQMPTILTASRWMGPNQTSQLPNQSRQLPNQSTQLYQVEVLPILSALPSLWYCLPRLLCCKF